MIKNLYSRVAARGVDVDVTFEARRPSLVSTENDSAIQTSVSLSVDTLAAFLPAAPTLPWRHVAGLCGSTLRAIQTTLYEDFEKAAPFFAELEFAEEDAAGAEDGREPEEAVDDDADEWASGSQDTPNPPSTELAIRNPDPAIPTIIITPCAPQPRASAASCWVPFQDACFGNLLVVPAHPVVNEVFPPLLAKPLPAPRRWEYTGGHWRAVLPTVEEQPHAALPVMIVRDAGSRW
ncbi:hypothetical protein FA95DRAFT_1609306 [Auriscalpium vulgare]|uniref:Uncharacterized protein n=1 Tax=Auriscalpium vulgare TaxID=40419 RepID=A0ACB8RH15_9AGAM|nr:hypothetical protein FA95DRAFT_1609306 [Auriscalpium vulgare]